MKSTFRVAPLLLFLVIFAACGGGGSDTPDTTQNQNQASSTPRNWSAASSALTIDAIVNTPAAGKAVYTTAPFYYGRFLYTDQVNLYTGSVKFKLNKEDDSHAYFSDFTLEHYSKVTDYDEHADLIASSKDLQVEGSYDLNSNNATIDNATSRFVAFDLDFGNNAYFGDITNAGVIFSADFTTMAGGNNATFFFIAQKTDAQPDVSLDSLSGKWNVINFTVSSRGIINKTSTSSVTVGGTGGHGFTGFIGTNSRSVAFDGELALTDPTSAAFVFGYGSGNGTMSAYGMDGAFLVSADESLALGVDITNAYYFAAEK